MITPASGTGCVTVLQAHTACKAEWLSLHGWWPPALLQGRGVDPFLQPPPLSASAGIPGWSGPLGGSEGLDQHAPWGGQAPGPQPTFEKQVRLQVIQNTSQLCWPQSRPLGSPGPKTQKPFLLNGARAKLTVSPVCLWVPSLGLSCRSGAVCFPLPPDTYHTGGSFHTGASSWGSWEGEMVESRRPLADGCPAPCPTPVPSCSLLVSSALAVPLELSSEERKWLLFTYFGFDLTEFLQPSSSVCIILPETLKRGVCPGVFLPWLSRSVMGFLCLLQDAAPLVSEAGRKVSAPGCSFSRPTPSVAPGRWFAASCPAPSS